MSTALQIVNEKFPNVNKVVDAKKSITVKVTKQDSTSAKIKQHKECAMAIACKRQIESCDGVMISLKSSYIIKGEKAYRFTTPESVSREIISFDRKAGFSSGEYKLNPPAPTSRLNARSERKYTKNRSHEGNGKGFSKRFQHFTDDVRTRLGSKEYKAEK